MATNYNEIEQRIVETFIKLVEDLTPREAISTLDYWIFIKYSHEFHELNEDEQMEVRRVLLALKLVHV